MNAVLFRGQMNQFRGTFITGMGRLTGNDIGRLRGRMLRLLGVAQVTYGRAAATAGKRIRKFTRH
jgi:uncharacterized protein YjbJ (UPF0337 family)